jgi:glycosyltransferase involved in cell wall biosynthesis
VKNTKLAIIIPYYKLTFFDQTLASLSNQTNKQFTVYIGDDASPENCTDLLKKYEDKLEIKYHYFNENLGGKSLVKQWERCIDLIADEVWFMILGDDDFLAIDVVEQFFSHLPVFENKSNVIRFSSMVVDSSNNSLSKEYHHPDYEEAIASYCKKLTGQTRGSLSENIFRLSAYKKFGFKDYKMAWGSDDRAMIDFSDGLPIFSIPALVYVRISELSISGSTDNYFKKIQGRLDCTREIIRDYKAIMNQSQINTFIGLYENLIYRSKKVSSKDVVNLLLLSFKYFGFSYAWNQSKSIFSKLIWNKSNINQSV